MEEKDFKQFKAEAAKWEKVSSEELVKIFKDNHIYFPDFVDRFLLAHFFKPYVFADDVVSAYTDEQKYRLRNFETQYSIYLIEGIDKEVNYSLHPSEYKNLFMRFFLKNKKNFKTTIAFEKQLEKLAGQNNGAQENFEKVRFYFRELFYTPKGYLDGIQLSGLKDAVAATYTLGELKGLGEKYGVDVPRRINKQQLIDLLAKRFRLTEEEKATLLPKPILAITQYAKDKGFKISTDLKKDDMVEFIVFSLDKYNEDVEKDLYDYDILSEEEAKEPELFEEEEQAEEAAPAVAVIPTSNEIVDNEPEAKEEPAPEPEPEPVAEPEPEAEPEEEEAPQEEEQQPEPPVEEEEQPAEEPEEEEAPQEEPAEEEQPEEEEKPEEDYDEKADEEIRDIIKGYYAKKAKKDRGARWIIVILFIIVCVGLAYFALKYFGVLK